MPVQYLLLACALFVVHGVSTAAELPVSAVVPEKGKPVDSAPVKSSPRANVRSKPVVTPASVQMPIKRSVVSAPVALDPATQNK